MSSRDKELEELKRELKKTKLIVELAKDRENWIYNNRQQIFNLYKELSLARGREAQYNVLLNALSKLVNFEYVCILTKSRDEDEDLEVFKVTHEKLREHKWRNVGAIKAAFRGEIIVLNDPSVAEGFQSKDIGFNSIVRSVILVPLLMQSQDLLFVCVHHTPLILDMSTRREVKNIQQFLAESIRTIEYKYQLEESVKYRTSELIEYQNVQRKFRDLSFEVYFQTDKRYKFIDIPIDRCFSNERLHVNNDDGPSYANVVGKSFFDILDPDYIRLYEDKINEIKKLAAKRLPILNFEFRILLNDKKYWIRINCEPIFKNNDFKGYMGIAVDVTNQYKQYEELQKARDIAELANRSKTEYLAVMSHEIKTPLQAILGMLDLLEQTDIDETQRSYIKHVSHSASLLQTILHDVLDLSKIETKSMVLESISFNLHFLLESSVIQMTDKAKSKNISLQLKLANDVPKFIVGDQHRLSQILFNLIKNAIKFTSEGGVVLTVERNRNKLRFTVVDTGTGMPSESMANLFKPFVQLDSSISRKYGGTGLGLAICKRLVEHMGGKIGVKSKLGVGSTFWFDLPLKIPSGLIGAESIRKIEKNKNLQYDILLADDSQINQFVIKTMLEKLGHTVELASNGQEAIEACKKKLPNLCFMDLRMPIMDGIEATRYIISEIADIPIVALTANSSDEERIECRKAGMISIASKPVTSTILKNLLSEFEHIIVEKSARLSIPIRESDGGKVGSTDNTVVSSKQSNNSEKASNSIDDLKESVTLKEAEDDNALKTSISNRIDLHEYHESALKDGHEIIQDVIKGNKAIKEKRLVGDIEINTSSQSGAMRLDERIALDKTVEASEEMLLHGDEIISSLNLNLQSDKSKS